MATKTKYADITIEPIVPIEQLAAKQSTTTVINNDIDIEVNPNAVDPHPELTKRRKHMGMKAKKTISNTVIYIVLVLMTIIWLFPFFGILVESFRVTPSGQVGYLFNSDPNVVWGFDNYVKLFTNPERSFGTWLWKTAVMGVAVAIIQTIFVLSMSYVLSRLRFKGRKAIMNTILILGMFPGFLTLILIYKVLADLGLTQDMSVFGLILVYCASSGMGYYISKGFFDTIPKSLDEAARVDGATRAQVFFKIILPMAKPIVIYTILMGFMAPWGDFMMASYIAHATDKGYNVAVGLQNMLASQASIARNYTQFCAGGVIVAIPITILFMCLQKYYVEGVTGGAVKG